MVVRNTSRSRLDEVSTCTAHIKPSGYIQLRSVAPRGADQCAETARDDIRPFLPFVARLQRRLVVIEDGDTSRSRSAARLTEEQGSLRVVNYRDIYYNRDALSEYRRCRTDLNVKRGLLSESRARCRRDDEAR